MPTNITTVIGDHNDYPISKLALSSDKRYLVSTGYDKVVRFWNVSQLYSVHELVGLAQTTILVVVDQNGPSFTRTKKAMTG